MTIGVIVYIFGVGFEVAYLSELGKFDGLESEISDGYGSHASLFVCIQAKNISI